MRAFSVLVLLLSLLPACTPYIPVKDSFGTSALGPAGPVPPELAEFNNYDPSVNALLADQLCATPYQTLDVKSLGASPGHLLQAHGRCRTHVPLFGP